MNTSMTGHRQNQPQTRTDLSRDEVAQRAYQLWEAAGRPSGRDLEHWLQAEKELLSASQQLRVNFGDRYLTRKNDEKQIAKGNRKNGTRAGAARNRLGEALP
jgi:hypothetical protein